MKKLVWIGLFTGIIIAGGMALLNYYFKDTNFKIDFSDELRGRDE
jgi:hypothetical protein